MSGVPHNLQWKSEPFEMCRCTQSAPNNAEAKTPLHLQQISECPPAGCAVVHTHLNFLCRSELRLCNISLVFFMLFASAERDFVSLRLWSFCKAHNKLQQCVSDCLPSDASVSARLIQSCLWLQKLSAVQLTVQTGRWCPILMLLPVGNKKTWQSKA